MPPTDDLDLGPQVIGTTPDTHSILSRGMGEGGLENPSKKSISKKLRTVLQF